MQAQITHARHGLQAEITTPENSCNAPAEWLAHAFGMTGTLSDRIRQARERKGWNQSDLARHMGVSPQTVQQWEKGGGVRPDKQLRLASVLGVTPDWLLLGREAPVSEGLKETPSAAQPARLSADMLRDTIAGLRWRFQLAGMEFVVEQELEVFALALSWALDPSPVRQAALTTALDARLLNKPNSAENAAHGSPATPHRGHRSARR